MSSLLIVSKHLFRSGGAGSLTPVVAVATTVGSFRSFFASSTDHSRLLEMAEIHKFDVEDHGMFSSMYVMTPADMKRDQVLQTKQLHLARLYVKDQTLYGAKVIQRTLGPPQIVMPRMVDQALKDIAPSGNKADAESTLHGVSEWVLKGLENKTTNTANKSTPNILAELSDEEVKVVRAIADGHVGRDEELYAPGKKAWDALCREYVDRGLSEEATLYMVKGAKLKVIEHFADTTDYGDQCGYAMARLQFEKRI